MSTKSEQFVSLLSSYVLIPLFSIWATYKIIGWVLSVVGFSVATANNIAWVSMWFIVPYGIYVRFKGRGTSGPGIGIATQTTYTGKKVKTYVFGIPTRGKKLLGIIPRPGEPLKIVNPDAGILIVGGAGAGKSYSIIEPIITQAVQKNYTGIVYDFKREFAQVVQAAIPDDNRVKQYYVDFDDLTRSHRVNPISPRLIINSSLADNAARTVMSNLVSKESKDSFFTADATALLSGIIWYLREEHPRICTLPHAMALANQPIEQVIALLSTNYETAGTVASIKTAVQNKAGGQLSAVLSTLQNALRQINIRSIVWVLSGDDFSLDLNNPEEGKLLTIANHPQLYRVFGPAISLIISVALLEMNQKNRLPSVAVLDELPTIFIPDFSNIPATIRSNKCATIVGAQDFSQLVSMYGNEEKDSILSNLGNRFYGRMSHLASAEYVSKLWGREYVRSQSQSISDAIPGEVFDKISVSISATERGRVEVQDVTNLNQGEFFGQLIDSDRSYFKAFMEPEPIDRSALPAFKTVSDAETKENFMSIQKDIQRLMSSNSNIQPEVRLTSTAKQENHINRTIQDEF